MIINTKRAFMLASMVMVGIAWSFFIAYMVGSSINSDTAIPYNGTIAWAVALTIVSMSVIGGVLAFMWIDGRLGHDREVESTRKDIVRKFEEYERIRGMSLDDLERLSKTMTLKEIEKELEEKKKALRTAESVGLHKTQD